MRRLIIAGFIGFQPAKDAGDEVDTIELSEVGSPSQSDVIAEALTQGLVTTDFTQIKFVDEGYKDAMAKYTEAAWQNTYLIAKDKAAAEREAAQSETSLADLMKNAEAGFVNLHTDNNENGNGDGKWYALDSKLTQHTGDTEMPRGEAIAQGIEIG